MTDNPKHRREGVPLDGAPDLGLFRDLGQYQLSDHQSAAAVALAAPIAPDAETEGFAQFGEYPGTRLTG